MKKVVNILNIVLGKQYSKYEWKVLTKGAHNQQSTISTTRVSPIASFSCDNTQKYRLHTKRENDSYDENLIIQFVNYHL